MSGGGVVWITDRRSIRTDQDRIVAITRYPDASLDLSLFRIIPVRHRRQRTCPTRFW